MKKVLKWIGIILAVIIALSSCYCAFVYISTEMRMNKSYKRRGRKRGCPTDASSIEYGKHVATIRDCINCHEPDLEASCY